MRRDFLDTLHCPYSGSRFNLSVILRESDSGIEYANINSEAGDFPIVDGILRLKIDEHRGPLVDLIKSKKPEQALLTALESPSYGRRSAGINFLDRNAHRINIGLQGVTALKRQLYRALTDATATLRQTADRLHSKSWANWQMHRFSMPAFLPVYPFLPLIQDDRPVLDFGCGLGQASFLISRKVPGSSITCADNQFSLLYLAKKFFVGEASFICLDGNCLLPFDSAYFSSVFSSDVVHLIDSKLSLIREFRRILSKNGAIILPHLHNRLSPVRFGRSLSPEGYGTLFEEMEKRIVPENWIVDRFTESESLDLAREWTREELNDAIKGLSIVGSNDASLFRRYTALWEKQAERTINPIINPLYNITGQTGNWTLNKVPDSTGKIVPEGDGYLPNKVSLALAAVDTKALLGLKKSDPQEFRELARKFVVIDVPERFQ